MGQNTCTFDLKFQFAGMETEVTKSSFNSLPVAEDKVEDEAHRCARSTKNQSLHSHQRCRARMCRNIYKQCFCHMDYPKTLEAKTIGGSSSREEVNHLLSIF